MYAVSNSNRIYTFIFLCLCAAFFLAPSLANANEGYWSTQERRFISQTEVSNRLNQIANSSISKPSGSTLSTVPSAPTITKNAAGGLSATTNNILKTLDQPSNFSSTLNNSAASAKNALKSCVRSPACAGRALGTGAVIYEGIQGWMDVYDFFMQDNQVYQAQSPSDATESHNYVLPADNYNFTSSVNAKLDVLEIPARGVLVAADVRPNITYFLYCDSPSYVGSHSLVGYDGGGYPKGICQYLTGSSQPSYESNPAPSRPVSSSELDAAIDEGYSPAVSDAPIVLLSGEPETISLSTPSPAELPATTTTNTDSQGKTTTTVKNSVITYNILNNNTSSPSIESSITETSNTYDETANLVGSMTSTTTNNAVSPDPLPPSSGASADIELPPFCTYASIVCDWIGWTKEGIEGEEPDLINLISEFEPDDNQYNSGIGSGSCPAPMSLNLGIINRVVEVSYQPFCDFLDMIRPLVIAGAWLLSAFMYVGVLRRG